MDSKPHNVFIEDHEAQDELENEYYRKISNYEEEQNDSQEDNNRYEEIDQILDNEAKSKQQEVLRFKVNELQKICNSLTNTNRKLIDRLTELQQQRQQQESNKSEQVLVDEYSQLNCDFTQVQSLIHQYKQSLDQFQTNVLADMKLKQEKISHMKTEINQLSQENNVLQTEREDLIKINKQLETRNQGLILEIQNLQKEKWKLEERISKMPHHYGQHQGFRYDNYGQNEEELPFQIQNQYEVLIEKLVKELEYERNVKKKMNEEIRRMSHELMESEKEIMEKNKKLYEIEMKLLRSSKTTADSSVNYSKLKHEDLRLIKGVRQDLRQDIKQDRSVSKRNHRSVERVEQKTNFKTFVLLQLINGELNEVISNQERKIIGIKVIQFYERKLERQDYSNVMPQNLLVFNFSHRKPELLTIRKVGTSAYEDGEKTQQSLVWNLAFILDNLFGQVQGIEDFNQILELTGQVLEKRIENSRENLLLMKQILYV